MSTPHPPRELSDAHRAKFFAYLDALPPKDRPVFGFSAQQQSLWARLGGGTTYLLVLFFTDHVVFSTRRMASARETAREARLLGEIAAITVTPGTLMDRATFTFVDGATMKLANVSHAESGPLARFGEAGLAAFDRTTLAPAALASFFVACSQALSLPDGLFREMD
jgi:uncharacterized protein (DUF2336 family)